LARLLYCVSLITQEPTRDLIGVGEQPVGLHDCAGLRVYCSDVANPETLFEGASGKAAEGRYRQVLRDLVGVTTVIAFPFPALVEDEAAVDKLVAEQRAVTAEALTRLAGMIQYELSASWAEDESVDLGKPVSGAEYLKRRQQAEARVAATDTKLRSVTAGIVVEWRAKQERRNRLWYALLRLSDRERFIAALRSAGPSEGVRLRLSGPWPPSEFAGPGTSLR